MNALVLYHGHCPDGMTAAWTAWRKLGTAADYVAVNYNEPPPDVRGRRVYILDFCYPRAELEILTAAAAHVTVLDHHVSAMHKVFPETLGADVQKREHEDVKCRIKFDLTKSGARLAWEFFHPGEPVPLLVQYVQARDLWTFDLPFSEEVSATISSYPHDFDLWNQLEKALEHDPLDLRKMRS